MVEHVLGKDGVVGSIPILGSIDEVAIRCNTDHLNLEDFSFEGASAIAGGTDG